MDYKLELEKLVCRSNGLSHFCDKYSFDDLFTVQMRDFIGNPYSYTVESFSENSCETGENSVTITFSGCNDLPGTEVVIFVSCDDNGTLLWNIKATPGRDYFKTEWIDFPRLELRKNSDTKFLIPNAEGTLITDLEERERRAPFKCKYAEYPLTGIDSFYPGPAAAQFEAVYDDAAGLYIGCHDSNDAPKVVDFLPVNGRVRTVLQQFTEGENSISGTVQLRTFKGNWQDAAEIYRKWMESAGVMPEKLADAMPQVLDVSPVILAYPVKGFGIDAGGLVPNEYYPYSNALPVIDKFNEKWDNPVMALLMHWEGTAPWAPPFIWPPSGGEELLKEFVDAMHERDNSVGLYASGIAWTHKSMIDPDYSLEKRFEEENVADEICIGPRGEAWSRVCNHPRGQRLGFDLCPARKYTSDVVSAEIRGASGIGVDYLQYFDQNQGCTSPLCYSKRHGHPDTPGSWQTRAMQKLLDNAQQAAGKTLIGCENAAAQPYVKVCKLNDLRNHLAWSTGGVPVALYSYLYHEYTSGFSGNGVWLHGAIDLEATPFFCVWNLAWNFVSGNLLSVVLKDKGDIHWNWCQLWSDPAPEQEPIITLIKNLSKWRRNEMKKYLVSGRMTKCPEVTSQSCTICTKHQTPPSVPVVHAAAWQNGSGKAVILANSASSSSVCTVKFDTACEIVITTADGKETVTAQTVDVAIPRLDAALIEVKEL